MAATGNRIEDRLLSQEELRQQVVTVETNLAAMDWLANTKAKLLWEEWIRCAYALLATENGSPEEDAAGAACDAAMSAIRSDQLARTPLDLMNKQ